MQIIVIYMPGTEITVCKVIFLKVIRMRDLDFRMIGGHAEPDQAKGDWQPLINVHLKILAGLGG